MNLLVTIIEVPSFEHREITPEDSQPQHGRSQVDDQHFRLVGRVGRLDGSGTISGDLFQPVLDEMLRQGRVIGLTNHEIMHSFVDALTDQMDAARRVCVENFCIPRVAAFEQSAGQSVPEVPTDMTQVLAKALGVNVGQIKVISLDRLPGAPEA